MAYEFPVEFPSEHAKGEFKLFDLPPSVEKQIGDTNSITIRGNRGDNAFLCTKDQTYRIRLLETSNTLLLAQECEKPTHPSTVLASIGHTYELEQVPPDKAKLKRMLQEEPFVGEKAGNLPLKVSSTFFQETQKGSESQGLTRQSSGWGTSVARQDSSIAVSSKRRKTQRYTKEQLRQEVACSDVEFESALKELCTADIDGYTMLVSEDTREEVLDSLIQTVEFGKWDWGEVSRKACHEQLSDFYHPVVIDNVLQKYGTLVNEQGEEQCKEKTGDRVYALNKKMISAFRAKQLFVATHKWRADDFLQRWGDIMPLSLPSPDLDVLVNEGLAIVEEVGAQKWVKYVSKESLPTNNIKALFEKLFEIKPRWKLHEITPFLVDASGPGMPVEKLLTRHAKQIRVESATYYMEP